MLSIAISNSDQLWLAIAEPSRRKLIDILLAQGEATASRLAQYVPFSRQAVIKHISVLRKAGLVQMRREGKEVKFTIDPIGIGTAAEELSQAAVLWDQRLQHIKYLAEHLEQQS